MLCFLKEKEMKCVRFTGLFYSCIVRVSDHTAFTLVPGSARYCRKQEWKETERKYVKDLTLSEKNYITFVSN